MSRFLQSLKVSFFYYTDPISYQLLTHLLNSPPNDNTNGSELSDALRFYYENQDRPINIYCTGIKCSILSVCVTNNEQELMIELLNSVFTKAQREHNLVEVYRAINVALTLNRDHLLEELIKYYKPILPITYRKQLEYTFSEGPPECALNFYFADFPRKELWRLFIDGVAQRNEHGWLDYEIREPGFILGMLNGFRYMQETISLPLSSQLLQNLHAFCSSNVEKLCDGHSPGCFRDNIGATFNLYQGKNASLKGVIELLEKTKQKNAFYTIKNDRLICRTASLDEIQTEVDRIINQYNSNTSNLKATVRLNSIIDLITQLERTHPFGDANCRTICILLLLRELIKNGLSPVILEDPNRFDGYSQAELFNEIQQGMVTFKHLKSGVIQDLGMTTEDINNKIKSNSKYAHLQTTLNLLTEATEIEEVDVNLHRLI